MKITNETIAKKFNELADLLEIEGANIFRVRAYRNAALAISGLKKSVATMMSEGEDLKTIPGIGKDLAQKIEEIIKTGELSTLKDISTKIPPVMARIMKLEGLGPKRVKYLFDELNIKSFGEMIKALDDGSIQKLRGFGAKLVNKIRQGIAHQQTYEKKIRLAQGCEVADMLIGDAEADNNIEKAAIAGSFRRRKDLIGDLDLLLAAKDSQSAIDRLLGLEGIEVLAHGPTRAALRFDNGLQVDVRVIKKSSFGAALIYFTGSKQHNILLRKIAIEKGLKLNEYGLFRNNECLASRTEKEVYRALGLAYIEPELREGGDEIEAAKTKRLPHLLSLKDIRGDLHAHTRATDGVNSLEEMALAAKSMGYEYFAITDHSKHLTVARGLNEKRLREQMDQIDQQNQRLKGITILKSIELDILEKGELDLPNSVLKDLDVVICSIHSHFKLSSNEQTDRIIRAMDNKYFNILAHPTGRLLNRRPAYEVDIEKIMKAALERGCFLEINAQPERLDINDIYCKMAKGLGLKLAISSDAHRNSELHFMKYGVFQARRGWLEKKDVINTRSLSQLRALLKRS